MGDFMITDALPWKGGGLLASKVPCGPMRTGKSELLQWMKGLTLIMEGISSHTYQREAGAVPV